MLRAGPKTAVQLIDAPAWHASAGFEPLWRRHLLCSLVVIHPPRFKVFGPYKTQRAYPGSAHFQLTQLAQADFIMGDYQYTNEGIAAWHRSGRYTDQPSHRPEYFDYTSAKNWARPEERFLSRPPPVYSCGRANPFAPQQSNSSVYPPITPMFPASVPPIIQNIQHFYACPHTVPHQLEQPAIHSVQHGLPGDNVPSHHLRVPSVNHTGIPMGRAQFQRPGEADRASHHDSQDDARTYLSDGNGPEFWRCDCNEDTFHSISEACPAKRPKNVTLQTEDSFA
jgi:hypothetical protein